jgi:Asp-tRNA(Asn)/Glu-tRNA(Gln) amidotransferase C subunit
MDKVCGFDAGQEHFALSPSPYGQLRQDQPGPSSPPEQILSNAKKTARNCFTVPKVI